LMVNDPYAYPEYGADMNGNIIPSMYVKTSLSNKAPDPDMYILEQRMLAERMQSEDFDEDDF